MTKVITYGTYDLLHRGHVRLLERAKALGDYLIVGITSDDFDRTRGKINAAQSLMERIDAVKALGIADEIIIEEYQGQKIDDIRRLGVDIFTVGSDWVGKFDYLKEYCKVVYLERTEGVSSSEIRQAKRLVRLGIVGESTVALKYAHEAQFVNGLEISGVYSKDPASQEAAKDSHFSVHVSFEDVLACSDAIYIISHPTNHFEQIRQALEAGKHVLCESPIALSQAACRSLFELAAEKNLVLMDAIKTAYSTAYNRMLLLVKSGVIGEVMSVDATCTSLASESNLSSPCAWNSACAWAPTGLLPVFQLLGTAYSDVHVKSFFFEGRPLFDRFTKFDFVYPNAVATVKVGKGVKSEGELIVSGTKGYVYVPAPWWKTDYFEVRYEDQTTNRRYFYQLDGEGIRYELVTFVKAIASGRGGSFVPQEISVLISSFHLDRPGSV